MKQVVGVLLALVVVLTGAIVLLVVTRDASRAELLEKAVDDPQIRREALAELVRRSGGVWDSYLDADVGRVLLPRIDGRSIRGAEVVSNELGMREGYYAVKKPEGVVRVVLLGDSYVFGSGIEVKDRFGVFLRHLLQEGRAVGSDGRIEVLHIGLTSWNILAECAYLRRQLDELDPDLVVHLTIYNDLEDIAGVRGFGEMAGFSPQVRDRGDSRMGTIAPPAYAGRILDHELWAGRDWEGRTRYAAAQAEIARLEELLEERGAGYLLLFQWNEFNRVARERLAESLTDDQQVFVSRAFHYDRDHWITGNDRHWNRWGNERIAKMLYAAIQQRELLPGVDLKSWPEMDEQLDAIHGAALVEMEEPSPEADLHERLVCPPLDARMGRQVYVGLDAQGHASSYVSVVLANDGARQLHLDGRSLGRPELRGRSATVFVEEHEVGTIDLGPEAVFPRAFPLPALDDRAVLNVRIVAEDWVYLEVFNGRGIAFVLDELALL